MDARRVVGALDRLAQACGAGSVLAYAVLWVVLLIPDHPLSFPSTACLAITGPASMILLAALGIAAVRGPWKDAVSRRGLVGAACGAAAFAHFLYVALRAGPPSGLIIE